jgi:ribose 5-phosphate isomerase B
MTIYLGADHAGFKLKEQIKKYLAGKGLKVSDQGAFEFEKNDDYPDYAAKVGKKVSAGGRGILFCGSSHGVCIAANKIRGARAVAVVNVRDAKLTREHNDANILCLSGWNTKFDLAKKIVDAWLKTDFSGEERHARRLVKIKKLER